MLIFHKLSDLSVTWVRVITQFISLPTVILVPYLIKHSESLTSFFLLNFSCVYFICVRKYCVSTVKYCLC